MPAMTPQTFPVLQGHISFEDDRVIIQDNRSLRLRAITSGVWVVFGVVSVLRFQQTGDPFLLWTGLIIAMGHTGVLAWTFFQSTLPELPRHDLLSMEVKPGLVNKYLRIRLASNRIRRVYLLDTTHKELQQYVQDYLQEAPADAAPGELAP